MQTMASLCRISSRRCSGILILRSSSTTSHCNPAALTPRLPHLPQPPSLRHTFTSRGYATSPSSSPEAAAVVAAVQKLDDLTLPAPKTVLSLDESVAVASASSTSKVYYVTRHETHYSCTCMAFAIQKGRPVTAKMCKHTREVLGDEYELARLAGQGHPASLPAKKTKRATSGRSSKKEALDGMVDNTATSGDTAVDLPSSSRVLETTTTTSVIVEEEIPKLKSKRKSRSKSAAARPDIVNEISLAGTRKIDILLAKKFELDGKKDCTGWWMSEKFDGIRAYWDGEGRLWSRLGNAFLAPTWFLDQLPKGHTLDGELWHSRNNFSDASSIIRSHSGERWNQIRYLVFDIPSSADIPFEPRMELLRNVLATTPTLPIPRLASFATSPSPSPPSSTVLERLTDNHAIVTRLVEQVKCTGKPMLLEYLKAAEQVGGEGLMLREPGSAYVGKRSSTLLKVKTFFDAEAKVVGYEPGNGKYEELTGSLLCEMESGRRFSCGSGLNDEQRANPPAIGAIVSYRFQSITKEGVPRFPTFIGERVDMLVAKDAVVGKKSADDEE